MIFQKLTLGDIQKFLFRIKFFVLIKIGWLFRWTHLLIIGTYSLRKFCFQICINGHALNTLVWFSIWKKFRSKNCSEIGSYTSPFTLSPIDKTDDKNLIQKEKETQITVSLHFVKNNCYLSILTWKSTNWFYFLVNLIALLLLHSPMCVEICSVHRLSLQKHC